MHDSNEKSDDFEFDPAKYGEPDEADEGQFEPDERACQIKIRPALVWECPDCGKKNIAYPIPMTKEDVDTLSETLSPEEAAQLQKLVELGGDDIPSRSPDNYKCRRCKTEFRD